MSRGAGRSVHPRRGRAGRRLPWLLGSAVLVALVASLGVIALAPLLGYGTLTVHSGSMTGTASVGSLVLARPLTPEQVRVGDVVLVRHETDGVAAPGVLHRVIDLDRRNAAVVVRTKGDANSRPDPTPYVLSGTTVTPVLVVPHAGRALGFVRTPVGWTAVVALPATVLLWLQLKAIWFPARRPTTPKPLNRAPAMRWRSRLPWLAVPIAGTCLAWATTSVLASFTDTAPVGSNTFSTAADWGACTAPGNSTVIASADSYVDQAEDTDEDEDAYGTQTTMRVKSRSNAARRSFVRFSLPAVPAGCTVTTPR